MLLRGLSNAAKLLLMDIDDALNSKRRRRAEVLINTVVSVNMLAARCSFDVGDGNIAITRLHNSLADLRPRVEWLVTSLVGQQPGVYFHQSVSDNYLDRYIQIQRVVIRQRGCLGKSDRKESPQGGFGTTKAVRPPLSHRS